MPQPVPQPDGRHQPRRTLVQVEQSVPQAPESQLEPTVGPQLPVLQADVRENVVQPLAMMAAGSSTKLQNARFQLMPSMPNPPLARSHLAL